MADTVGNEGSGAEDQQDETASISSSGTSASKDKKVASNSTSTTHHSTSSTKRMFSRELRCMMYGFGDDQNPYTESVEILEDMALQYIIEMTTKALEVGRPNRLQVEDIIYLVRNDPRKYARVKDLLSMNEELKRARKAFDEAKY